MYNPGSTYRLQFHKGFTFAQLEAIIPYLKQLGVQTVYASPIFESVPGSTHGYDCVNPHRINPEIGTEADLRRCIRLLKQENIGWLQDIVPNHMAFHPHNKWLMDVLQQGRRSAYASLFDIYWDSPVHDGKLMVPFLGDTITGVIETGALHLAFKDGTWCFRCYDSEYPINDSWQQILNTLPESERSHVNEDKKLLQEIADGQYYSLCHWQETDTQINYRRFFTVNGLICLRMEEEKVFEHYHRYIRELLSDGLFDGLRVDHVDGLYNPEQYLQRLRQLTGPDTYIIVEKILQQGEAIPESWPVQGNTGYDFLAWTNNLLTAKKTIPKLSKFYQQLTGIKEDSETHLHAKKTHILLSHMEGELDNLYRAFLDAVPDLPSIEELPVKLAIGEFLETCPVYRYYGASFPLPEQTLLNRLFAELKKRKPELEKELTAIEKIICGDTAQKKQALHFYQRCMQLSGPLMAKGMEDTLMYTYNSFIGHNEVGDTPHAKGFSATDFHHIVADASLHQPLSLNATATHDTKRGEDVRARLSVLTDTPKQWIGLVTAWRKANEVARKENPIDINDEYFLYQTIIGSYPVAEAEVANYAARLKNYMEKALREAKTYSDWATPDEAYENAVHDFAASQLQNKNVLDGFLEQITDAGMIKSLAQLAIKYTAPGIPDLYQGCELWDYSFVDPDNRRAVDFEMRRQWLDEIITHRKEPGFGTVLWQERSSGKIKLWATYELLQLRRNSSDVFEKGKYLPLELKGKYKDKVIAFARQHKNNWVVLIAPVEMPAVKKIENLAAIDWHDTRVLLPPNAPLSWRNIFAIKDSIYRESILLRDVFTTFPTAVLVSKHNTPERSAGILMHITSLPSPFGIGDLGPEAFKFADFLKNTLQRYWQLLPLNPTDADAAYSPYSSISSQAGNTLLISPEVLTAEGLLLAEDIVNLLPPSDQADFINAARIKKELLDKAYQQFEKQQNEEQQEEFAKFMRTESDWLDDFALFVALKSVHKNKHWTDWPDLYKHRDPLALATFSEAHSAALRQIKWLQFIFFRQWKSLRAYCNNQGIQLFGDLPFYVSHDSADTWSHPEIFCLDANGMMSGIAGVPPDYFSEDGQLWGMPTYNWHYLKTQHYSWWRSRLRKNLELFDLLRIDHFRAFAAYWQVNAGAATARFGKWHTGPGIDFFRVMETELNELPFIAEDLGDHMDDVYALRNSIPLPGMRVLQFAFGNNMPVSVDIPHNYDYNTVVYTGTHDNNTILGWYREETKKPEHKRMQQYTNRKTNQKNVHLVMNELAYASVARIAILPMQDILGLDETHRMNTPGTDKHNWQWRLLPAQLTNEIKKRLVKWVRLYNRI